MYMVNFKTRFGATVILAAMLLSGCQSENESLPNNSTDISSAQPEESSSVSVESSVASSTQPVESSSAPAESSTASSAQPVESTSLPEEPPYSEPPYSEPPVAFPADRVYPDDELVPSDWLRVTSYAEGNTKINDILNSDTSGKDLEDALAVLMDRNLLVHSFFYDGMVLFETDWDAPYVSPDFEYPIHPITSEYFPDVKSISDLVYDTYEHSAAEDILHTWDGEPLLTEVNGRMYKNSSKFPKLNSASFSARSYVEIIEKTENKCTFIWHFPDMDLHRYNQPESGYEFFYHKKAFTAEYIDGCWKLNDIVFDNGTGHVHDEY